MKVHSENDEENKKPGPAGSGEQGTGQDTISSGGTPVADRQTTAPFLVERVTAVRGLSIACPKEPKSTIRRQTLMDINSKDPEIPYMKFEKAARDLVCSLMERQDRMNEEIFFKINDLGYRIGDLEQDQKSEGGGK